jgi:hypothetical protein
MGVAGPVMCLADSEVDNPAFHLAAFSVGIEKFTANLVESNLNLQEGMVDKNAP